MQSGATLSAVTLSPYSERWPHYYADESAALLRASAFGDANVRHIFHMGSTSVAGLAAKPIIDILVAVGDLRAVDDAADRAVALGYIVKHPDGTPCRGIPLWRYFRKRLVENVAVDDLVGFNVHIYRDENPEISRHLLFRDYLAKNAAERHEYAALKTSLALRFPFDLKAYTEGKDAFIRAIDAKSGYVGERLRNVEKFSHWEQHEYKRLAGEPYVDRPGWHHFVFYRNVDVVGVAVVSFRDDEAEVAEVQNVVLQADCEHMRTSLLKLLDEWIDDNRRCL